jgi:Domain of unknown function (DUF4349)
MRKTGFLTFVLVVASSAFGCGASAAVNKPSSAATTTTSAENQPSYVADQNSGRQDGTGATVANAAPPSNPSVASAKPVERRQNIGGVLAEKISLNQTHSSQIDTAPTDRKIIRNADLSLEAKDPDDTQRRITSIAEANGGFVVESQQTSSDLRAAKRDIVTMSIRVPSQNFGDTLDQIRASSEKIVFETVKGDDVTEEFIDIEARLKAKKALEQQFVEIMKKAYSINDALNVQSELADVRGEIEKIEGRMRFLENQSSLSTIKIKLQTPEVVFSASSKGVSDRFAQSFATGANIALDFVLCLMTFLIGAAPFAIFFGLPIALIVRYLWRKHGRSRTIIELAKEELDAA